MRIDQIELSGSLFVTSSASIILGQTKISSDNNGSISFTNVNNPTQKVIGSYSGSFTGSIKLPTVPQGTSETNIVLVDGSGGLVYRSNLSLTGAQGNQGTQGSQGIQGTVGTQGFQGFQGDTGAQGTQGTQGIQGTAGTQGIQGTVGAQGSQGAQGIQGTVGTQGATGASAGITSYTNPADNRVLTSVNSTTINAESNLIFDGTNLGLGVTPSAWSDFKVLEFANGVYVGTYTGGGQTMYLGANNYFNGTDYIYKVSAYATRYQQASGAHQWFVSTISGTAGNVASFTQAMTLDASGRLGIGTTSPNYKLDLVSSTDASLFQITSTASANNTALRMGIDGNNAFINATGGSSGTLQLRTYGSTRATLDTDGNVGIGTTSPTHKLDVAGNQRINMSTATTVLEIYNTDTNDGNGVFIKAGGVNATKYALVIQNAASTNLMTVLANGNIGIGTTSPTSKLTVVKSTRSSVLGASSVLQISDASATGQAVGDRVEINFYTNSDSLPGNLQHATIGIVKTNASGNEAADLYFGTSTLGGSPVERMRITSDGNVGIGTTSPVSKLSIVSSNSISANNVLTDSWLNVGSSLSSGFGIRQKGASNGISGIQFPLQMMTIGGLPFEIYTTDSQPLILGTNSTERLRITSGGQVNVNSNQTTYPFYVNAALTNWTTVFDNTASGAGGLLIRLFGGSQSFYYGAFDGSAYKFYVSGTGNVHSTSTSITIISSDEKLKTDIRDYNKGLTEVLAMKPRIYKRKDNLEIDEVGFVAQEMDIALPGSMIESYKDEEGEPIHTYQLEWYPLLVKAIQEQNQLIQEQKQLINNLESRLKAIENN